eukprot:TRINITY_DN5338_c0_g1_i1.p2 TRINITY_DN5338_c0_g1~~TRINITY_DN5338_c0_g1_i1.p2  ORF type:complete len:67 (+),score=15.39 TRINITY_DN5338_c0_g1_i1:173-373(+)
MAISAPQADTCDKQSCLDAGIVEIYEFDEDVNQGFFEAEVKEKGGTEIVLLDRDWRYGMIFGCRIR